MAFHLVCMVLDWVVRPPRRETERGRMCVHVCVRMPVSRASIVHPSKRGLRPRATPVSVLASPAEIGPIPHRRRHPCHLSMKVPTSRVGRVPTWRRTGCVDGDVFLLDAARVSDQADLEPKSSTRAALML